MMTNHEECVDFMRCLPYKAIKKNIRNDTYIWLHQDSKLVHSFNDQPAYRDEKESLLGWGKDGSYFREYNKPTYILMSVKGLHFIDSNLNRHMPLTDKNVHPDYRKQWREWHQDLAK